MLKDIDQMIKTAVDQQLRYQIEFPGLPLAIYRELAAHLRQVEGVQTDLLPQQSQEFDYYQSQIDSLCIEYSESVDLASRQQVDRILEYYQQRYVRVISH